MAKDIAVDVVTGLSEHPAAMAWSRVAPGCGTPGRITLLKRSQHVAVFRLEGVGPAAASVIAKRCEPAIAAIERTVYEDILPALPVTAIRLYGWLAADRVGSAEGDKCWLFMEDAGNTKCSCFLEEHRVLAGNWLGELHASTAEWSTPARLPSRGPGYYFEILRSSREIIRQRLTDRTPTMDYRSTLEDTLRRYDTLEAHWSQIERFCADVRWTLVHGDLSVKNAHVRSGPKGNSLLVIDWGDAGWGVPAIDMAQVTARSLSPDFGAYSKSAPPDGRGTSQLTRMAAVGEVFRLIVCVDWECQGLLNPWVERPIRNIEIYEAQMADCLRAARWGN